MDFGKFDSFESATIDSGETKIFVRYSDSGGGRGSGRRPLLLLHGFPETHLMWRGVASALAEADAFAVVCADLRGYGASGTPPSTPDYAPYAKRAMAADMVGVMRALGHSRFCVAGHDRGARVAYRLALDHPASVERLAVLDIIPTAEAFRRADARLALAFWPWSLLAQPAPLPERLITAAPEAVVEDAITQWGTAATCFSPEVRRAYVDALRDPTRVHAICEEYRAAATLDVDHDLADLAAGRRITCPTLVLWAKGSALDEWYRAAGGPLEIWRAWAPDVQGHAIEGGHFFPEQHPRETAAALRAFFNA